MEKSLEKIHLPQGLELSTMTVLSKAGVAQSVEQLICNQPVGGSNPSTSSIKSMAYVSILSAVSKKATYELP